MDLLDLFAKISLDSEGYKKGLNQASADTESFGAKLGSTLKTAGAIAGTAIVATGTAVTGMTKGFIDATASLASYGDEIDKNSQKMGVSSSFYQEWDAVLQHSGSSMSSMTQTFRTLANASQSATDEQALAFEQLGLSMDEVASMSAEELFTNVIYGLQGMEESTERTALATTLLGRGSMEMGALLNTSAEDTQAMIDTVNQLGGVLSVDAVKASAGYEDSLQDMQTSINGLKNGVISDFLPSMSGIMNGLTMIFSGDEGGANLINNSISDISKNIQQKMPQLLSLIETFTPLFVNVITSSLPMIVQSASTIIVSLINGISSALPELLPVLIPTLAEGAISIIGSLGSALVDNLPILLPIIIDCFTQVVSMLTTSENLSALISAVLQIIMAISNALVAGTPQIVALIPEIIGNLIIAIGENLPLLGETIITLIEGFGPLLVGTLGALMGMGMEEANQAFLDGVEAVKQFFINIGTSISNWASNIGTKITTFFSNTKSKIQTSIDTIKTTVSNKIDTIKTNITSKFELIKSTIFTKLESIKTKFTTIFDNVKSTVSTAIDKVKSAFNFSWSLPQLKLPHLSVSGGVAPYGIGGAGSLPSFSISWYKKAYEDAYLLNNATIFGASNGHLLGGGEGSGSEAIVGTELLKSMMAEVVSSQIANIDLKVYLDDGTLVGKIAPRMDAELGRLASLGAKGVY